MSHKTINKIYQITPSEDGDIPAHQIYDIVE